MIYYIIFLLFLFMERLTELYIASDNEKWMRQHGGVEVGASHYKYFILLHCMFFLSMTVEVQSIVVEWNISYVFLFFIAQIGRVWCMTSLGRFWNTKVIILPNVICIQKGPYKYMKHPNYVIVFIELFTIPLIFGAYRTAMIFPLLHLLLLCVRIPVEERALGRKI